MNLNRHATLPDTRSTVQVLWLLLLLLILCWFGLRRWAVCGMLLFIRYLRLGSEVSGVNRLSGLSPGMRQRCRCPARGREG